MGRKKWRKIFYSFNKDVVNEVITVKTGDYIKALDIFDIMMEKALKRGDYYAEGAIHLLPEEGQIIPDVYFNMIKDFRQIQTEWAYLSRLYMVARILGIGDEAHVTQKFYELARRIKEKLELILGKKIADEMINLLSIYVIRLGEMVNAILSGDEGAVLNESRMLHQGAQGLAAYLDSVNPYWEKPKWEELIHLFNSLLLEEAHQLQANDHREGLQTFQELLNASHAIGDYLVFGLYQFTMKPEDV